MQKNFVLVILLSLIYMFRATVSPIFRSTLAVYTAFWNNVQTVLSAANRWHRLEGSRQHSRYFVPKRCIYSQSSPEDGRNCRPKHVEQALKESIKQLLLHLVGCWYWLGEVLWTCLRFKFIHNLHKKVGKNVIYDIKKTMTFTAPIFTKICGILGKLLRFKFVHNLHKKLGKNVIYDIKKSMTFTAPIFTKICGILGKLLRFKLVHNLHKELGKKCHLRY
jgi:hypothetical protein